MDGTLSDVSKRKHFLEGKVKDWDSFYKGMRKDKPRKDVIGQIERFIEGNKVENIYIITSRRESARGDTMEWINEHVPASIINKISHIYMRDQSDMRPDIEVKKEIYNLELKDNHEVVGVFEDRPRVVKMYEDLGLNVIDVGDGIDF